MNRLCRKCNVRGEDSDNPDIDCYKIKQKRIMRWIAEGEVDRLEDACQYNVHSAWFDVDYGGCKYGIFSAACPTEGLHSLELGLMSDCLRILFEEDLKPAKCALLDDMAKWMVRDWARQRGLSAGADDTMPRLLWSDGITNLAQMNAKYKLGMMFTVVVFALTEEGKTFFIDHFGGTQRYRRMVYVFQLLLSYWMWLKKETFWLQGDIEAKQAAKTAIQIMLRELKTLWPRESGQEWRKAKFHEQLHVPDDIDRNGAPLNYHTGPTEHHHLWHVKNDSRSTQRRRAVLDQQIAAHASESYLIDLAYQCMTFPYHEVLHERVTALPGISKQSSHWKILFRTKEDGHVEEDSIQLKVSTSGWRHSIEAFLAKRMLDSIIGAIGANGNANRQEEVTVWTEYGRKGHVFRAHGDYRGNGVWYDWAVFRWEKLRLSSTARARVSRSVHNSSVHYGDSPHMAVHHDYSPGQVLGFIVHGEKVFAIANCCALTHAKNSVFSTEWKLEDAEGNHGMYVIDTESIVRPCLMTPNDTGRGLYNEIWAKERWADEFNVTQ